MVLSMLVHNTSCESSCQDWQQTPLFDNLPSLKVAVSVAAPVIEESSDSAGLSTLHISPQRYHSISREQFDWAVGPNNEIVHVTPDIPVMRVAPSVSFIDGGNLASVTVAHVRSQKVPSTRGIRGAITEFTKASRRRLMRLVASTKMGMKPVFVTLTYPGVFPTESKEWKRHLDNLFKRVRRNFPGAGAVWRLEMQKRGAPHYHLLIWGLSESVFQLRAWFSQAWYEVVGSGDSRHLAAGVRVEVIRSQNGTMYYCSKYLSKPTSELERCYMSENGWSNPGRFWGVHAIENVPVGELVKLPLSPQQAMVILEQLLIHAGLPEGAWHTLTVFMENDTLLGFLVKLEDFEV